MIENVKLFRTACKNVRAYLNKIKKLQLMMYFLKSTESILENDDAYRLSNKQEIQINNCNELMELYYSYIKWVYQIINKIDTPYYRQVIHEQYIVKSLKGRTGRILDCSNQTIYNECKLQLQKAITDQNANEIREIKKDIQAKEQLIGKEINEQIF